MTEPSCGWPIAPLGQLVDVLDSRRVPVSAKIRGSRPGPVPYYGATGQVGWINEALFDEELVLLGEDGVQFFDADKPKAYRVAGPAWVNNHAHVLRARDVSARYLMHYLNQFDYRGFANGTTRLKLTQAAMRGIPVAAPPIDEQRRIVEILEDHLSRLDAADAYLAASSRRLASLELRHAERLVGASGGRRTTLGELAIDCGYGTSTKCVAGGPGSPVVRIPNLVGGRIDLTDEKRVADPKVDVSSTELTSGDLLVVRTNGSRDLIGRAAVVQPGVEASFASYLIRFQLDRARVRPDWVRIVLGAPTTRRRLEGLAASSAGQYNLGLKKLSGVPVPVPSLEAQDRMLLEYEDGLDCSRRMASATRDARARSTRLRRALLHAAFTGRLTGGDRDADVLGELEDLSRVAQLSQG